MQSVSKIAEDSQIKKTYTYEELRQLISNKQSKAVSVSTKKDTNKTVARTEAITKNKQVLQFMAQNSAMKAQIKQGKGESREIKPSK